MAQGSTANIMTQKLYKLYLFTYICRGANFILGFGFADNNIHQWTVPLSTADCGLCVDTENIPYPGHVINPTQPPNLVNSIDAD